jgi:hypothetical protein
MTSIKHRPNHQQYLKVLKSMTTEQKLLKAFQLSTTMKELFLAGLKKRFPHKTSKEINSLYMERITKCYNRNY